MHYGFLLTLVVVFTMSCASTYNPEQDVIWTAMDKVLSSNNLVVRESNYREGTMVAVSQVHGDFMSRTRVKVVARVIEDEEGFLEPHIRVLNQMDLAEARTFTHPSYQSEPRWINLSNNQAMEAKLLNEVYAEVAGAPNPYRGKAWQPPYLERTTGVPSPAPESQPQESESNDNLDEPSSEAW